MKNYILLFLFLSLSSNLYSQNKISFIQQIDYARNIPEEEGIIFLDSLSIEAKKQGIIDTFALIKYSTSFKFFRLKKYREAINYSLIAIKEREKLFSKTNKGIENLSKSYMNLSLFYERLALHTKNHIYDDSLVVYAQKVIDLGSSTKNVRYPDACQKLSYFYTEEGDYTKGLKFLNFSENFYLEADTSRKEIKIEIGKILLEKAQLYNIDGASEKVEKNLPIIKKAIHIFTKLNDLNNLGVVYLTYAHSLKILKKYDTSIEAYQTALKYLKALDKQEGGLYQNRIAKGYNNLGAVYFDKKGYKNAFQSYEASLQIKTKIFGLGLKPEKAAYHANIADIYFEQKKYQRAAQEYHNSIRHFTPDFSNENLHKNPTKQQLEKCQYQPDLLQQLNDKAKALSNWKEDENTQRLALNTLLKAEELIQIMRKNHMESGSKLFWREKTKPIFENALSICHKIQEDSLAFFFLEKSKSILLLDALSASDARDLLPKKLADKEQELLRAYRENQMIEEKKRDAKLTLEISNKLDAFLEKLKQEYPNYYETRYATFVPSLYEKSNGYSFEDSTVYIQYFYGKDHIYALKFGAKKSSLHRLNQTLELDALIHSFIRQFKNKETINNEVAQFNKMAFQLYNSLVQPLFPNGVFPDNLVLIPDDILSLIPFEALRTKPKTKSVKDYLLYSSCIQYAYSISVLNRSQDTDNQKVKILGLAPFSNRNLDFNQDELSKISTKYEGLYLKGDEATKQSFLENKNDYSILHLSTHAKEQGENGTPEIFFEEGNSLQLSELYGQDLNHDLVILSACETGLGEVKKGEGILSLNRGFTYVGVKSIISSLWQVDASSTSVILTNFYDYLAVGKSKSNALHLAKKKYLSEAGSAVSKSPYFWAGLTFYGADGQVELEEKSWFNWNWIIGGVVMLFLVLVLFKKF